MVNIFPQDTQGKKKSAFCELEIISHHDSVFNIVLYLNVLSGCLCAK